MALTMVLGSFSGIPVYADEEEDLDPDCGFYTAADMNSDHYITPDSGNPQTYTDGYTVYFVYKNQVGKSVEADEYGEGAYDNRRNLSVSDVKLNYDGSGSADYTVALGTSDESRISFVKDSTTNDYTACKLTIPAGFDIGNAYVDVTYTSMKDNTETSEGCWLWTKQLKTGLVQYTGDSDSEGWRNSVTQFDITKNTGISACDYGNYFFGIATVDESGNTSYVDADFSKLSIQKKSGSEWVETTDGTLEHPENEAEGCYRYFFTSEGTYSITYTDGSTVSRVIVNVSPFDSGYVTDPADFAKGFIIPDEYMGQVFYYQGGKSDTFYFVFNTNDGTRYISKDSSGNVILYRDDGSDNNIPATIDGVTVTKDTAHSVNGYEVYKITLTDSYDFGNSLILRLLNPYVDEEDGQPKTNENDCYVGIELSDSGLNFSDPGEGDDGNPVYNENSGLSKKNYFTVEVTGVVYLVTKSDEGEISRYTSVPDIRTLDGTPAGTSAVTIEQNTDSSDADGLYNITFHQAGTYKIVSSDGSYVIANVSMRDAAYYRSAELTGANLIENYAYQVGKSNTIYFAFDTYDGTRSIATDSGKVLLYRWDNAANDGDGGNVLATLDGVTVTRDTTQSVTGYEIYKITLDDNYDFTEGFNLRLLCTYEDENGEEQTNGDDRYIGIEMDDSGLNAIWAQWDDDSQTFSQGTNEPTKLVDVSVKGDAQLYFVTGSGENMTECTAVPTVQTETGADASSVVTIKKETKNADDSLQNLYVVTFSKTGIYRFAYNSSYVLVRVGMPEAAFYSSSDITVDSLLTETYSYKDGAFDLYLAIAQETDGDKFKWGENLANGDGRTNTAALEEYGLTVKQVTGTTGYDIYELSATSGFALTDWMELYIQNTTNGMMDSRGISLNCQPAAGSLVASWEEPNEEHANYEKIMGVNDQYNWFYLSKAVYNTSTKTYTYIPVTNISDIKIVKQDNSNKLTISEVDADKGHYLFRFEEGNASADCMIQVGDSCVEIAKDPQIVRAYMSGSTNTSLTESEDHYAFDITKAENEADRTFYVSFNRESLGDDNFFYNFYAGNRSEEESSGTVGEYYYYADSELKDSTEDWAGNEIKTKLSSEDVAVTLETNTNDKVVLKIVVGANAPANLIFHVGAIISDDPDEIYDVEHPWIDEKYILVTKVETKVDPASKSLDSSAVDEGKVTITDVPAIADLDLATNLGNENSLKDDEATTAQKVEVSIKTDVINVTVDEDGKVKVAEGATEEEKKVAEEQKTAVETIIEKKNEVLSKNYSAIFLDLSVTATVTKTKTDMVEGNVSVSAGEEVKVPITETSKPFTIKVPIPKAQQDKRGFSIIRYHEDKNGHKVTERLEATVVYDTNKRTPLYLEFQTDRFSTYALAYREATPIDDLDFSSATWEVTGDNTFTSDGEEKTLNIDITGMPESCTYTLKGTQSATAKGTYTVYVDEVTYTATDGSVKKYAASDVDLPSAITKGYTWTILDANLTADAAKDDSEIKDPNSGEQEGGSQIGGGIPNSQTPSTDKTDTPVDKTGAKITENADGKKIIVNANGEAITSSKVTIGKKSYITDKDGVILTNQVTTTPSGNLVYVNKNGVIVKGKVITTKDGKKYYAKASGALAVNGFCKTKYGNKVYADKNGVLKVNKVFTVNGKKYYAKASGAIATTGFVKTAAGNTVYATKSGVLKVNKVFTVNGKKYVADKNGKIVKGKKITIGSYTYTTDKKGVVKRKTKKK
jgi:hypothetical protein